MSVTAVSAVVLGSQNAQHSGVRQDLLSLQKALSAGNLSTAQKALSNFQQDVQNARPTENGVRIADPAALRKDMQALQSALDSGDLAMANQAFQHLLDDTRQVAASNAAPGAQPPATALPKLAKNQDSLGLSAGQPPQKSNGNLIDVMA